MLFEYVKLHAFKSADSVCTFHLNAFSEEMRAVLKDVHASIDEEEAERARRRLDEEEHMAVSEKDGAGEDEDEGAAGGGAKAVGKKSETAKQKIRTEDLRDLARRQREANLKVLQEQRPAENADDPRDLAAIEAAKANMGDFKLKGAEDYVVPERMQMTAERKRRQIALLFESIQNIRSAFNMRVMQLRILKGSITDNTEADNVRLAEINAQLGIDDDLMSIVVDPTETPEARFTLHAKDVVAYGRKHAPELFSAAFSAEEVVKIESQLRAPGGAGASTIPSASAAAVVGDASASAPSFASSATGGAEERTVAWVRRQWSLLEMGAERVHLIDRMEKSVAAFDGAIRNLCSQKASLGADLKAAEMRSIVMHDELQYLKDEEKRDRLLQQRLYKIQKDSFSIVGDLSSTKVAIAAQSKDVSKWKEKQAAIINQFQELVPESNEHRTPLYKIFKRRIRRAKQGAEGEEEDSEESDDMDDDSESESDDDDEEEMCPIGCDQALYDKVRELREKRCSIEEVRTRRALRETCGAACVHACTPPLPLPRALALSRCVVSLSHTHNTHTGYQRFVESAGRRREEARTSRAEAAPDREGPRLDGARDPGLPKCQAAAVEQVHRVCQH